MSIDELEDLVERYHNSASELARQELAEAIIADVAAMLERTKGETSGCRFCGG